jgi:hypothetical protein
MKADPSRNRSNAPATATYPTVKWISAATSATRPATQAVAMVSAVRRPRRRRGRTRLTMDPATRGRATTTIRFARDVNCVHVRMARLEDQDRSGDHDRDDGRAHEGAR